MKQSKVLKDDLKPEYKNTNRILMDQTTDIDNQTPTIGNIEKRVVN